MAYKVGTLQKPVDTRNVELCNAAFKPIVDAINKSGLLVLQDTVNWPDWHLWLNYYKFKDHSDKGLRILAKYDTFDRYNHYFLESFDWTDDLDIYNGDIRLENKHSIYDIQPNDLGNISWLYEEGSVLQINGLNVFYIKSPDGKKRLLVGMYSTGEINRAREYTEFLNGLGQPSFMVEYRNQQGQNIIIPVAYLSFSNQYYTDKIYAGSRWPTYVPVAGQKYRMTDIETGRSETVYYMCPHFFREV